MPGARSSKACLSCHVSKVKCDVSETGPPCSRCKKRGLSDCNTFTSRRGTYDRKEWKRKRQQKEQQQGKEEAGLLPHEQRATKKPKFSGQPAEPPDKIPKISREPARLPVAQSPAQSSSSSGSSTGAVSSSLDDDPNAETWGVVVEYFLKKRKSKIKKSLVTYLGESSPLSSLLKSGHIQLNGVEQDASESNNNNNSNLIANEASPASVTDEVEMQIFEQRGCFRLPKKSALETLFKFYFENVHPFNPVVNRMWFANKYREGTLSHLLIHSVCFAACYHCPMSAIYEAEFSTRRQAKVSFYSKAKTLFDCNYEKDKLVAIQSCILLSFWGGKPNDVWNSRTWLGVAFSIAEDLGMHRSTENTDMHPADKSHFRIIWWCLCSHDILSSLTIGRPPKVTFERCDAEKLTLEDFAQADEDPGEPIFGFREIEQSFYHIEVSKLTMMLHQVFMARCDPRSPRSATLNQAQYDQLLAWQAELPPRIDWNTHRDSLFALCLRILYHNHVLYIFRPRTADSITEDDCSVEKSLVSASEIALAASKLSMMSMTKVPQHVYGSFVMSMVILAMDSRYNLSSSPDASLMQLQICKMVLSQSEGNWDHSQWVLKVFDRLVEQSNDEADTPAQPSLSPMAANDNYQPNASDLDPSMQSLVDFCAPEYNDIFKIIFGGE